MSFSNPLDPFISSQILSVERQDEAPRPRLEDCLRADAVARISPAARLGLQEGDALATFDGRPGQESALEAIPPLEDEADYSFYLRASRALLRVRAKGIALGVKWTLTPEAVRRHYRPEEGDPGQLHILWKSQHWPTLERLARLTLHGGKEPSGLGKLFGSKFKLPDHPAMVLLGSALLHQGKTAEGMALVREYMEKYASHWTLGFRAVGLHALGTEALAAGRKEEAHELFDKAYYADPLPLYAEAAARLSGRKPVLTSPLLSKPFPVRYTLPALAGAQGEVSLEAALQRLKPGQFMLLCLLDGYRGNGPYNEFMITYLNYGRHFRDHLAALHVITEVPERPPQRAHYFKGEDEVLNQGLPASILLDDGGSLASAVEPMGSPWFVALKGDGTVLLDGELDEVLLWNLVAAASGALSNEAIRNPWLT